MCVTLTSKSAKTPVGQKTGGAYPIHSLYLAHMQHTCRICIALIAYVYTYLQPICTGRAGYLMKSKYKIEKFGSSRRYFNLSGCLLQWWENEADAKAKALGSIDLAICTFHQHGEVRMP